MWLQSTTIQLPLLNPKLRAFLADSFDQSVPLSGSVPLDSTTSTSTAMLTPADVKELVSTLYVPQLDDKSISGGHWIAFAIDSRTKKIKVWDRYALAIIASAHSTLSHSIHCTMGSA